MSHSTFFQTLWNKKGIESEWSGEKPYRDGWVRCRKGNTEQHWQGESVRALCYLQLLLFMTYKKHWRGRRRSDRTFPSFPWLQPFWTSWLFSLYFPLPILSPPLGECLDLSLQMPLHLHNSWRVGRASLGGCHPLRDLMNSQWSEAGKCSQFARISITSPKWKTKNPGLQNWKLITANATGGSSTSWEIFDESCDS